MYTPQSITSKAAVNMRLPYRGPDALSCVRHYGGYQRGGGVYPVFSGSRYQRGHGAGEVLGGLFRSAVPFLKRGLVSAGGYALRSGGRLLKDLTEGVDLKTAAKARLEEAKQDALGAISESLASAGQSGSGRKRIKLRSGRRIKGLKRIKHQQIGGIVSRRKGDIFG